MNVRAERQFHDLIMVCLFFEAVLDSTDYLVSYSLNIVTLLFENLLFNLQRYQILFK
jgi:hypothetical protein